MGTAGILGALFAQVTLGDSWRIGVDKTEKTTLELADTVDVPKEYIDDLIAGRRRPPRPGRTDIYDRMTSFLGLSRNELANSARTEREATAPKRVAGPKPTVRRLLLELCVPETAKRLEERRAKSGGSELVSGPITTCRVCCSSPVPSSAVQSILTGSWPKSDITS